MISIKVCFAELTALSTDQHCSTDPPTTETGRAIQAYFDELPSSEALQEIDTQTVLNAKPSDSHKTLRKDIQEITGDGKVLQLPAQEQHILYEASMYICTHVSGPTSGSPTTEVYLWAGNEVSASSIEDAQLFGKRIAKEAVKGQRSVPPVQTIRQMKEPAAFFQALGGIVITRRGSRADAATKPYMLCGRPHMGYIAFDEIDLHPASLCSAFPYIVVNPITLQDTKVYLWKGTGCNPEAVGSARLISMDLNTTSDIVEISEGKESKDFLSIFPGVSSQSIPATLPSLHGITERASPRLFRIDAVAARRSSFFSLFTGRQSSSTSLSRPTSSHRPASSQSNRSNTNTLTSPVAGSQNDPEILVTELSPFSQADLEPENIYVLDCIGTVFVLPGPLLASSQHRAYWQRLFVQACLFADDYAILAAGMEDRQSVPKTEVVLAMAKQHLPREIKMVFRSWDERRGLWGTGGMMAGRVGGEGDANGTSKHGTSRVCVREVLDVCCVR